MKFEAKSQDTSKIADIIKLYSKSTALIMNQAPFGLIITSKPLYNIGTDVSIKPVEAEIWFIDSLHYLFKNGSILQIVNNDTLLKIDTTLKMVLLSPIKRSGFDFKSSYGNNNIIKDIQDVSLEKDDSVSKIYKVSYSTKYHKYSSVVMEFDKKTELVKRIILYSLTNSSGSKNTLTENASNVKKINAIENEYTYQFNHSGKQECLIHKLISKQSNSTWTMHSPYNNYKIINQLK